MDRDKVPTERLPAIVLPDPRPEPVWSTIDPVLRSTVRALWDAGFHPVSWRWSGVTPHRTPVILLRCLPIRLVADADRLWAMVRLWLAERVDLTGRRITVEARVPIVEAVFQPATDGAWIRVRGVAVR